MESNDTLSVRQTLYAWPISVVKLAAKQNPLAIALMGPTASGKTDLAIALSQRLNAEIISVDSALVYRGMDIGSAKPSSEELALAPHKLIDIRDPADAYSVAEFCRDATAEIEGICSRGKTPLLVGGTMMYFKTLLEGLSEMPASEAVVREEIEQEARRKGWPALHEQLKVIDPLTAATIHPNHSQRIGRALEVYRLSGRPMSEFRGVHKRGLMGKFDWRQIALAPRDRTILHQRIAERFEKMLELGFIAEVEALYRRQDCHTDLPSVRAVGYRQVWEYLDKACSFDEMRARGIAATRQLAKRQLTWLRAWPHINWLYTQNEQGEMLSSDEIVNKALSFLT